MGPRACCPVPSARVRIAPVVSAASTTDVPGPDSPSGALSGRWVGNSYLLVRPIGHGATGTVWRAVDRATGDEVAVKLLREELVRQPKLVTRFVQERAILLMLRHEHIVRVRDLLTIGESLGLVMDLVDGGSLREYLHDRGTLPTAEAAAVLRRHVDETPHRYPEIPARAWTVIEACMAKSPQDRPSAEELVATLDALAEATDGVPALAIPDVTPHLDDEDDSWSHPSAL